MPDTNTDTACVSSGEEYHCDRCPVEDYAVCPNLTARLEAAEHPTITDDKCPACKGSGDSGYRGGGGALEEARRRCTLCGGTGKRDQPPTITDDAVRDDAVNERDAAMENMDTYYEAWQHALNDPAYIRVPRRVLEARIVKRKREGAYRRGIRHVCQHLLREYGTAPTDGSGS